MNYFGKKLVITDQVKYVGEGEDPAENIYMKAYAKALKEFYGQPERLSPGDHIVDDNEMISDSLNQANK
jgi:hypothetical protein